MDSDILISGFGYDPVNSTPHFVVRIPREPTESVTIRRQIGITHEDMTAVLAEIDVGHWNRLEERIRLYFNRRLKREEMPSGIWRFGDTNLGEGYGKELALLFWGLEDATAEQVPTVYGNWQKLTLEERVWLYGRVMENWEHPERNWDRGWHKAIRAVLQEEPVSPQTLRRVSDDEEGIESPLPNETEPHRTRKRKALEKEGQLRLL